MTTGDPWYGQHRSLSDRMLQVIPSDARTPEELLIEAEEQPAPRRTRALHPARRVLKKLPRGDRELLLLTYGHELEQRAIGRSRGVSHQAISKRLSVAQKRLAWLRGPGGLFTADEVHTRLRWYLQPEDVTMLRLFWRLRNMSAVAREVRRNVNAVRTRLREVVDGDLARLAASEPEVFGRFVTGFRALRQLTVGGCSIFRRM